MGAALSLYRPAPAPGMVACMACETPLLPTESTLCEECSTWATRLRRPAATFAAEMRRARKC
jgi:hypothetical protein